MDSSHEQNVAALKGALFDICAATLALVNMGVGQTLGLYTCLAENRGLTAAELAEKTGTDERYIEDWLVNQTLNGLIERTGEDGPAGTGVYSLTAAQAACLADAEGPNDMVGGGLAILGVAQQFVRITDNFRSGGGIAWADQHPFIHEGVRRFFAPVYRHFLTQAIVPALDGVESALIAGCRVCDIGCGFGESTLAMGRAYPNSTFIGVDYHQESIDHARSKCTLANVSFTVDDASTLTGGASGGFDLVTVFDCFHDFADPDRAAVAFRSLLNENGSLFLIEPMAGESVDANRNAVGRVYSGFSPTCCLQCAKAGPGKSKLGTLCPTSRARGVFEAAGFSRFAAVSVPGLVTNRVYQIRL